MQMIHKFAWNLTKGILVLVSLNYQIAMQRHVANLCHVCYYYHWGLQRVRRYLPQEMAVKVANALISSHLNDCNSLLSHKKALNYQTSKSSKCLMPQRVQTKQIQSCDTLTTQTTLASHSVPCTVQIQPFYLQSN